MVKVSEINRADRYEIGYFQIAQIFGIGFFPDCGKHSKTMLSQFNSGFSPYT